MINQLNQETLRYCQSALLSEEFGNDRLSLPPEEWWLAAKPEHFFSYIPTRQRNKTRFENGRKVCLSEINIVIIGHLT